MIRLHIEPPPPPDEAAAIEVALTTLVARYGPEAQRRLRYGDIADTDMIRARIDGRAYRWSDVARIEALEGRSNEFDRHSPLRRA